jgi:hypothetical protein
VQPLPEYFKRLRTLSCWTTREDTDPRYSPRRLRLGDEQHPEDAEGEGDKASDDAARHGRLLRA